MAETDDLIEFLRACIAEDEADARDASGRGVDWCVQESRAAEGWGTYEGDSVVLGGGKPLAVCDSQYGGGLVADHIVRWDPARVLAECEAKRRIVELHQSWPVLVEQVPEMDLGHADTVMRVTQRIAWLTQQEYRQRFGDEPPTTPILRALALPYADRPGYREEWKP